MRIMAENQNKSQSQSEKQVTRITVTLPAENYNLLVRMAKNKKVSASWLVRDAVDKYLSADIPLLKHALS